jgi:hypothetical protein
MSLQAGKRDDGGEIVHSSHEMEGYRTIGDDEEPTTYKNTLLGCLACFGVISIMIFFIVRAVKDYTPSSSVDLDAFKQDFGPFLQSLSFEPSDDYYNLSQGLSDKYPDFFLADLARAMSSQAMGQSDDAQTWLQKAIDDGDGDDYFSLLPTQQEFQDNNPSQSLIQINDKIWTVSHYYTNKNNANQPFSLYEVGYIVLLNNGSVLFLNPLPLESGVLAQLRTVTNNTDPNFLVEPTKQHYQFLPDSQRQFPAAKSYGVQAQKDWNETSMLDWTGFLDDANPLFPGEFTQITFQGQTNDECAFYHVASKTIILSDLLMDSVVSNQGENNYVPGTTNQTTSFFNRLYYWTYGAYNSLAVPNFQNSMNLITNQTSFSDSIKSVTNLDIANILFINGGVVGGSDAKNSLQTAFSPYVLS